MGSKWFIRIKKGKNYSYLIPVAPIDEVPVCRINSEVNRWYLDTFFHEEKCHIKEAFILSEFEVFGSWIWGKEDNNPPRKPFKFFRSRENRAKYLANSWLRTPDYDTSGYFCRVGSSGCAGSDGASYACGIVPVIKIETEYLEKKVLRKKGEI